MLEDARHDDENEKTDGHANASSDAGNAFSTGLGARAVLTKVDDCLQTEVSRRVMMGGR